MSAPLEAARAVAERLLVRLEASGFTTRAVIAGSIRRLKPMVKDIEILAEPARVPDGFLGETRRATEEIREYAATWGRLVKGADRYVQVADVLGSGLTLDLFLCHPPAEWGPLLAIRTGPAAYSEWLVTKIKGRLWRCREGHVVDDRGRPVPCPTEQDFFAAAGVQWIPPEERRV